MSKTRHGAFVCPAMPHPVTTLTDEFPDRHEIPRHLHPEHQLIYASRGVMSVWTSDGMWIVPPQRAVWIPAKTPHAITMHGAVSMRTLYVKPRLVQLSPNCRVVNVSPLLRELILHACTFSTLRKHVKEQAHVIDMILDQLNVMEMSPLLLVHPTDARALRVAEALAQDAAGWQSLDVVCQRAGASRRTIERLFQSETNMSLGRWRQQLRLACSLRLLAQGESITRVAVETGYSTPSAFVAMFRKALGTTPKRYFGSVMLSRGDGEASRPA